MSDRTRAIAELYELIDREPEISGRFLVATRSSLASSMDFVEASDEDRVSDFEMPSSVCPHCGYVCDHAANLESDDRPNAGDVTVCIDCAAASVFADDLTLRKPTTEEEAAFPLEVARYQLAIRETLRKAKAAP